MQYQGGKSRIAKPISEVIINEVSRWEVKDSDFDCGSNRERERERERERVIRHSLVCSVALV